MKDFKEGYYWARDADGNRFITLYEMQDGEGWWYVCGVTDAINDYFDPQRDVISRVKGQKPSP